MDRKLRLRRKRKLRIRAKITGSTQRPRLVVYRSNTGLYVQIIDDSKMKTLISSRCMGKNKVKAAALGKEIAQKAIQKKIVRVVFDRGGYRYHGTIAALADAVREGGVAI